MSDSVNDDDLSALAAEFVLGTLDPDERTRANVLLEVDEGFRALVAAWERRLGELHLMVEPVEPGGQIFERIRSRLGIRVPDAPPPVTPPPFVPPPVESVRSPATESRFESRFESRPEQRFEPRREQRFEPRSDEQRFESRFESRLEPRSELPRAPQLQHAAQLAPEPAPVEPTSEPQLTQALTPERQLADILEEADKFSVPRSTDTTAEPDMVELPATVELHLDAADIPPADLLLTDAADAIATKFDDPLQAAHVEGSALEMAALRGEAKPEPKAESKAEAKPDSKLESKPESWPSKPPRRESMLAPADVARVALKGLERRAETWRAAMLFMSVVALGLGSLIAAWRYAPDRLPPRLQPSMILGWPDLGPSERIPAQHGTQFEE